MSTNDESAAAWPSAPASEGRHGGGGGGVVQARCATTTAARRGGGDASGATTLPTHFIYDSGNYSSSNTSEIGGGGGSGGGGGGVDFGGSDVGSDVGVEMTSNHMRFQHMLREKDQALFLALQDLRKLRSELERLSKSEQWYKQELRVQKSTRLDALERLYAQERKYMQENQRLQRECVRLYEQCSELEQELEGQKQHALQELRDESVERNKLLECVQAGSDFEIEQQQALIHDQQQLISVLRKQKRALLEDLQRLTVEKDAKVLELQGTLASMEVENTRITRKCKQLLSERHELDERLRTQQSTMKAESREKEKLRQLIAELREQLGGKEEVVALKEQEIAELQKQFHANLSHQTNADEVHRLSMVYHEEIGAKTAEITSLKTSLLSLQEELNSLAEVQTEKEQQERVIDQLNFTLETRIYELDHLQQSDAGKAQQLAELQLNLERFRGERDGAAHDLSATQCALRSVEQQLIALNEQYAGMCALCERTRFELEICEIERGKLKFQTASDHREIQQLREKLRAYLHQTSELSVRINELEQQLATKVAEKQVNTLPSQGLAGQLLAVCDESQQRQLEDVEAESAQKSWQEAEGTCGDEHQEMLNLLGESTGMVDQLKEECLGGVESREQDEQKGHESEKPDANATEIAVQGKEAIAAVGSVPNASECPAGDLDEITRANQKLLEELNAQREFMAEKAQLLEKLEKLIASDAVLQESGQEKDRALLVNMETLVMENRTLKARLAQTQSQRQVDELQHELLLKSQQCEELQESLRARSAAMVGLQRRLLENDAKLYRMQRTGGDDKTAHVTLRKEHGQLQEELQSLRAATAAMAEELRLQRADAVQLRAALEGAAVLAKASEHEQQQKDSEMEALKDELEAKTRLLGNEACLVDYLKEHKRELYANLEAYMLGRRDAPEETLDQHDSHANAGENTYSRLGELVELRGAVLHEEPLEQFAVEHKHDELPRVHAAKLPVSDAFGIENDSKELASLRVQVKDLEEKLRCAIVVDEQKSEQRVGVIQKLLEQQNVRESKLHETQAEWEELLRALVTTQELEDISRRELELKRNELEELNELFAEQNDELRRLQEYAYLRVSARREDKDNIQDGDEDENENVDEDEDGRRKVTFQEQLDVMEAKLERVQAGQQLSNKELKRQRKDVALQVDSTDREKEMQTLQAKIDEVLAERNGYAERVSVLERQVDEMQRGKREAIFMADVGRYRESSCSDAGTGTGTGTGSVCSTDTIDSARAASDMDERLRILTKVLECEYRRKMKRYDVHIRTLLQNVKGLKRALRQAEQKVSTLSEHKTTSMDDLRELQVTKRHLEELRCKYEQSQCTIKALEATIEMERQQYEATDLAKSETKAKATPQTEPAHEVANLIDDYKKLIQQSAVATRRPKTSAILDLIQRSNQIVPNLSKFESSVEDLRQDIHKFIHNYTQHPANAGGMDMVASYAGTKVPSLMEELRAAHRHF